MDYLFAGWEELAGATIVISILLSGMALGLGKAFSIKKLEHFGLEELFQSIINSAILGLAATISLSITQLNLSLSPDMVNLCSANTTPINYTRCVYEDVYAQSNGLNEQIMRMNNNIAYYSTLDLHFGNFSISPLKYLDSASTQLSHESGLLDFASFSNRLNSGFLLMLESNWFATFFVSGLVFRSFFITRRFGAFLLASSFSFILFYPFLLTLAPLPHIGLSMVHSENEAFISNPVYASVPIIDLNDNYAIASKIYSMGFTSGPDYVSDLAMRISRTREAVSLVFNYCVICPLIAFAICAMGAKYISAPLSNEMNIGVLNL